MANQYTKLFIENKPVDLFVDESGTPELPLSVNRLVNDSKGSTRGDYSRASITIPASKTNVAILGLSNSFKSFRLEIDGQPVPFQGTAQTRRVQTKSNGYGDIQYKYELNLTAANGSWLIKLGNTKLSELTNEVIEWDITNVTLGFFSFPNVRNWAFGLIKWKEWENSKGTVGSDFHYMPSVEESTPLLYIRPLIIAAFNSIGYTVISDYLDTDEGSKLVIATPLNDKMPKGYNDEYLNTKVALTTPYTFALPIPNKFPFDVITKAAPSTLTAYDVATYKYEAPLSGYYSVSIDALFSNTPPPAGTFGFLVALQVNGTPVSPAIGFGFSSILSVPYPAGERLKAEGVVFVNEGDTISWLLQASAGIIIDEANGSFVGEATREFGMPINFKYLLDNLGFVDMLSGLKAIKNLSFETNEEARTVTIEPKDGYINTNREEGTSQEKEGFYKNLQKDYTQLIDREKTSNVNFPEFENVNIFKYKSDQEETTEWIEGNNVQGVYEARFNLDSGSIQSNTKTIEVPFFAKTIHVLDIQAKYPDTNVDPQFPLIYPQNYVLDPTATEADYNKSPRIMYHAGQRFGALEGVDGYIELFGQQGTQTRVPATFMVNYNDQSGLDPNLGFNSAIINGIKSMGQLEKCYLKELARKKKAQLKDSYVKFNSIDNQNFSFRIKAMISNQRYVVQELKSYNPLRDNPTQFFFFLDAYPTQEDVNNIQDNGLIPVVSLLTTV